MKNQMRRLLELVLSVTEVYSINYKISFQILSNKNNVTLSLFGRRANFDSSMSFAATADISGLDTILDVSDQNQLLHGE